MRELRTLSVFTENRVGLLHRVTSVFTRRNLNIESLTVSESELPGVHRFTIVASLTRAEADKLAAQLDRQVEVLKALVHDAADVIHRELVLFKLAPTEDPALAALVAAHGARELPGGADFRVVEKTGSPEEVAALRAALAPGDTVLVKGSNSVGLSRLVAAFKA